MRCNCGLVQRPGLLCGLAAHSCKLGKTHAGASTGAVGSGDELLALRELLVKAREATVKLQAERDAVRQ